MKTIIPICCILLLALAGGARADEDQAVQGTGKGSIILELDRADWAATEPITGKLIIHITEVRDRLGRTLDAVRLNSPRLDIVFPDDMAAIPLEVKWRTSFFATIKVGHRYELQFSVRADEAFEKLAKKGDQELVLLKPGRYRISASLDSPARPPWDPPSRSAFTELQQFFVSEPKAITIEATTSGNAVGNDDVKSILAAAEAPLKHRITTFYAKRKVLSQKDLLAAIEAAADKPKADLASLYLSLGYPATDLTFFKPVSDAIPLTGHGGPPLYLLARPQQRLHFSCDLAKVHGLRVGNLDTVLSTKKQVEFDSPRGEGVYEMYDATHKQPWGWLLVHADKEAIAAAGLRPDTTELANKVAQALFKQDAALLQSLAAPGFRAEDTVKKLRFLLAEGDVRYHESTGTSGKVLTRMKINLAPKGSDPVFARELRLEFIRVGEDLKLSSAAVWDVEK